MEKKEKNYLPSSIKEIKTKYGSMIVANFKMDELKAIEKKRVEFNCNMQKKRTI